MEKDINEKVANVKIVDLDEFRSTDKVEEKEDTSSEKIKELEGYVDNLTDMLKDAKNQLITKDIESKNLKQFVTDLNNQIDDKNTQIDSLNEQIEGLQRETEEKQDQCDKLDSELDRERENTQSLEQLNRELRIKLEEATTELNALKASSKQTEDSLMKTNKDLSDGLAIYRDALIRLCRDVR